MDIKNVLDGFLKTMNDKLDAQQLHLTAMMDEKFTAMNKILTAMDEKFTAMDQKLTAMDEKFTAIDQKLTAMDEKFTAMDEKFTAMNEKFTVLDQKLTVMDDKFVAMDVRLQGKIKILLQRFGALDRTVSDLNELLQRQELSKQYGQNFVKEFLTE